VAEIPIDFGGVTDTARKVHDAILSFIVQLGTPQYIAVVIAGVAAALVFVALFVVAAVIQGVVGLGALFAAAMLGVITKVRTENAADFNRVIAAALSELLGYEISPDQFSAGQGPQGINDRITSIGRALHDLFRSEFVQGGPITPEQGRINAEKFSGFAINFATGSAFVSILTEAVSIGFLKEFRELGVETAQALGIGRLQRLALQPLIRNAIQQPYDLYYKNILRPDRLSEAQVVQALKGEFIQDSDARQQLAEKGYRDSDIDILLDMLETKLSPGDLVRLMRYNVITEEQAVARLKNQGINAADSKLFLNATDEGRGDSEVSSILATLEKARLDGFMDQEEFAANLDDLPLGDEELRLYRKKIGIQLERPRKRISFAQLKTGFVSAIIDLDYVDRWLAAEGYSDEDQLVLTYELIEALANAEAKAKAKAKTAAKIAGKGKPIPPVLNP